MRTEELSGPYAKARAWLICYLQTAKFKNALLSDALKADWSGYPHEKAAYLLGTVWGRLRQLDNSLETEVDYMKLVQQEMDRNQ